MKSWVAALLLATAALTVVAQPARTQGAFSPTAQVAGRSLVLNGSGTRYKAIFKVYDAALYAREPVTTAEALLALEGPKWLHLVARRDIGATELGRMLVKGINDANRAPDVMRQFVGLSQVGEMFGTRRQINTGETFGFEFRPGIGTLLLLNGKAVGAPVVDAGFFEVVMRMWLGANPVDLRLRAALLGQAPADGVAMSPQ